MPATVTATATATSTGSSSRAETPPPPSTTSLTPTRRARRGGAGGLAQPEGVVQESALRALAELYAACVRLGLVANLGAELLFVVHLLSAPERRDEPCAPDAAAAGLLSSVHNCVFFAVQVVDSLFPLWAALGPRILDLLAKNPALRRFAPPLRQRLLDAALPMQSPAAPSATPEQLSLALHMALSAARSKRSSSSSSSSSQLSTTTGLEVISPGGSADSPAKDEAGSLPRPSTPPAASALSAFPRTGGLSAAGGASGGSGSGGTGGIWTGRANPWGTVTASLLERMQDDLNNMLRGWETRRQLFKGSKDAELKKDVTIFLSKRVPDGRLNILARAFCELLLANCPHAAGLGSGSGSSGIGSGGGGSGVGTSHAAGSGGGGVSGAAASSSGFGGAGDDDLTAMLLKQNPDRFFDLDQRMGGAPSDSKFEDTETFFRDVLVHINQPVFNAYVAANLMDLMQPQQLLQRSHLHLHYHHHHNAQRHLQQPQPQQLQQQQQQQQPRAPPPPPPLLATDISAIILRQRTLGRFLGLASFLPFQQQKVLGTAQVTTQDIEEARRIRSLLPNGGGKTIPSVCKMSWLRYLPCTSLL